MGEGGKLSRYAHFAVRTSGETVAYSALTGRALVLTPAEVVQLAPLQAGGFCDMAVAPERLVEASLVVPQAMDEVDVVRRLFGFRNDSQRAHLEVVPTLGCNFDCHYCFERHDTFRMPVDVQDAVVEFAVEHVAAGVRPLDIEWFGGEPLLMLAAIERISDGISKRLPSDMFLPGSIITNGYLLTRSTAESLIERNITSAQVTIDGPLPIHDGRRHLINRHGTFEKIVANVLAAPSKLRINIRVNVDRTNAPHVFELLQLFADNGLLGRCSVDVTRVENYSGECRSASSNLMTAVDFASFLRELTDKCLRRAVPWSAGTNLKLLALGYCMVDNPWSFVIRPDGGLLKCNADLGNENDRPKGSVRERRLWSVGTSSELVSRDPFQDEECASCSLLPSCMGGCPRLSSNRRRAGEKECPPMRYDLPSHILGLVTEKRTPLRLPIVS